MRLCYSFFVVRLMRDSVIILGADIIPLGHSFASMSLTHYSFGYISLTLAYVLLLSLSRISAHSKFEEITRGGRGVRGRKLRPLFRSECAPNFVDSPNFTDFKDSNITQNSKILIY